MSKRYLIVYHSPRINSCADGKFCEQHEGEIIYGKPKGYRFWLARLKQYLIIWSDDMAYTALREVRNGF